MKGRIPVAVAAAALLAGAATAWADLTPEGAPYATGNAPYTAFTADFNGDGRPDVATGNGDGSSVSVFLRQAGGGFVEEAGSPFAAATSNGTIADVNGDGRPDIVTTGFLGEGVSVLLRNPGGGFTDERTPFSGRAGAAGAGDFNGDGLTDLAIGAWDTANVSILLRNGTNTGFTTVQNVATGNNPRQIAVADFNGDGRLDLAVANNGSATATILLGTGSGGFSAEGTPLAVGAGPVGIVAADFDGNGRPDLAVSSAGTNTVSIWLRNATGFTPDAGSPIAVTAAPGQIAVGDFDRNGTPDVAVAANGGALEVLHRVPGGWTRDTPIALAGTPSGVAVADFNGDGFADAAVTSSTTNQLFALLSPSPPPPPPPPPTATPTPTPQLPPPARGEVNVIPAKGTVKIKRKGAKSFTTLTQGEQIPVGAELDTRKGTVTIIGPNAGDNAQFRAGIFKISQSKGLTTLTLTEKLAPCKGRKTAKSAAAKRKPKSRKLWGDGKGRFRTNGQYGAATVRGTKWLLTDTCNYTRVKVTQGSVSFRDKVKRKTVIVRKAKIYTARKKGR